METKIYSESSSTASPLLLERPKGAKVFRSRVLDSFRNGPGREFAETTGAENGNTRGRWKIISIISFIHIYLGDLQNSHTM